MARSRNTFQKRQKEKARFDKRKRKEERREEAKERKENMPPQPVGNEDPDIAGIIPGPQPLPDQWNNADGPAEDSE